MITAEHQKELFSLAYMAALAAKAGANINLSGGVFDYGIDLDFKEVIKREKLNGKKRLCQSGVEFQAQVKCVQELTEHPTNNAVFSYDLKVDNYNDLIMDGPGSIKRLLIVVDVPSDDDGTRITLNTTEKKLELLRLAYWVNLSGKEESTNSSTSRIEIPKSNIFDSSTIKRFFECVKNLEPLS